MPEQEIPVRLVRLWLCDLCLDGAGGECHTPGCALWINRAPDLSLRNSPMVTILDDATAAAVTADGQWLRIAFMGHVELTGYVTEVTIAGQPAFHVDLPARLWGGNPDGWEEYSGTALYSRMPVSEESVRSAWEAQQARLRRIAEQEAEWERQQRQYALEAGSGGQDDEFDDDQDDDAPTCRGAGLPVPGDVRGLS